MFKMKEIIIREAEIEDGEAIASLLTQLGYPTTKSDALEKITNYEQPTYKLLVALIENNTVGYIALHYYDTMHWQKPIGRITSFCVDEKYRNSGVGIALLKASEEYFSKKDCQKVEVSSNKRRTETHQFYLNRGYQERSKIFAKLTFS
jgi:N-acetylglutamate synthase-like GNAT family acetyltransferase